MNLRRRGGCGEEPSLSLSLSLSLKNKKKQKPQKNPAAASRNVTDRSERCSDQTGRSIGESSSCNHRKRH